MLTLIVRNKGDIIRTGSGLRLLPGTNIVKASDWNKFASHPLNKILIEEGELVPNQSDDGKLRNLADLNAAEAVETVKDTFELAVLAKLREEEAGSIKPRETVLKAIDKQVTTLEKEIEDAKENK